MIFEPAVVAANLKPVRGDSLFRPSPIMADIWQMIQDAKVLVAELTQKNANVFYELGLAHALGKPVILVSETIEDVPFDLQPLRVILYDKSDPAWGAKLRTDLVASLGETLQDVTKAVPPMFRKVIKSQAPEDSDVSVRLSELERRVAAISPAQQSLLRETSADGGINEIDWAAILRLSRDRGFLRKPEFRSRSHAVAWTMDMMRRHPAAKVKKQLTARFGGWEAEAMRVYDLAATGRKLEAISKP